MDNDVIFGNIVLKVHEDLNRLQENLKIKENQGIINASDIKDLIVNTQNGLQKRAEELLNHLNNRVTSSSNIENKNQKHIFSTNAEKIRIQENQLVDENKLKAVLPISHGSHGENVKRDMVWKSIANPHNKMNRAVVNEVYDIQLPLIHGKLFGKNLPLDSIQKGSTVQKLEKLPLKTNKNFNNSKQNKITEIDAKKGLLNLIERGLIPPNAKIILYPPAINKGSIPVLSATTRNRINIPSETNDHGYNVASYHIDENFSSGENYISDTTLDNGAKHLDKIKQIIRDRDELPLPNSLINLINTQKSKASENPQSILSKAQKSNHLRSNREIQKHIASIKSIKFNKDIEENKEVNSPTVLQDKKVVAPPPPTTPALILSKSSMDSYHKIVIKNGNLCDNMDDYLRFKRHYCLIWGGIVEIIEALENLLKKYSIPLAFVNGDRVADLSVEYELELNPSDQELLSCIINRDDILTLIKQPNRRFIGENRIESAALVIQCCWRAYIARKAYMEYRRKKWAAGVIAIQWILHMKMTQVKEELKKTRLRQLDNYRKRFEILSSKWIKLKASRRVIIHIPSFGLGEKQRSRMKNLPELQNHQMGRLCDLIDDNVDVIYVSPVTMSDEILQYYSKLLGLKSAIHSGNSNDQKPINNRYKIIVPEALKSFPNHNMCLSTILKYSPDALNRIKNITKGRVAWIIPGSVHVDDLEISDELDVPILGTEPQILNIYRSKSEIKKIFVDAKVDIPPGDFGIISLNQLHESLAQLITNNLNIKKWIFKTNFDIKSQGLTYIDISAHLSSYSWAQKEQKRYGNKWKEKWAHENAYNRILSEIPQIIEKNLKFADRKYYANQSKFWKSFFSKGGVIEAYPGSDSVTNITVNIFIDPIGNIHITGSGDQIHDGNLLNAWGYSVPQSSIESDVLNNASYKISEVCKKNNIRGYFSIDFVTFIENSEENQYLWALDIGFHYSDLASLMNLSIFATNAKFKADDHLFFVEKFNKTHNSVIPLNRYVCLSTQLSNVNLSMVHYSVFFQMCRARGIGFDLKEKQGTLFALIDSFNRENISMITIGNSLEYTLETFAKNLYTLHQDISSPNTTAHGNFMVVIKEIENILGLTIENSILNGQNSLES